MNWTWLWNFVRPWRYKYWIVVEHAFCVITVWRSRVHPVMDEKGWYLLDGPFDTTDETAQRLAFWEHVLFSEFDDEDCDVESEPWHEPWEDED